MDPENLGIIEVFLHKKEQILEDASEIEGCA